MSVAKHWAFTLNNFTPDNEQRIAEASTAEGVVYVVFGREVGSSGTPHLQGHVSLRCKKRIPYLVQNFGQAHWTVARNVRRSIEYCKKDGDFREFGSPEDVLGVLQAKGTRNDLESFKSAVEQGMYDFKELRKTHSGVMARYRNFCRDYVNDYRPALSIPNHSLHDWQQKLVDIVSEEADSRTIHFVIDEEGNRGKSYLCDYLEVHYGAQVMKCGKRDDMAYELQENPKIVCVDVSRSAAEYLNLQFLEDVKDGRVFSPKYESRTKRFKSPHVLVFMNVPPDFKGLSKDRWENSIYYI